MRLSTAIALALTVLLATSALGAVAAAPSASVSTVPDRPSEASVHGSVDVESHGSLTADSAHSTDDEADQQTLDPADPAQIIRINVTETGDAEWTIESRFLLTDEDDVDTFEAYAADVTAGDRDVAIDRELFEREAANAEASTGRSMSIEGVGWNDPRIETVDETPDDESDEELRVGVISYSFTWTNFATTDDDRIHFGDAFETSQGPWLSTLAPDQRLVVQSPPGYSFEEFATPPTTSSNGAFVYDGPAQFETGDLDIVFVRVAGSPIAWWSIAGIGLLVLVVVALGYAVARRRSDDGPLVPPAIGARLRELSVPLGARDAEDTGHDADDAAPFDDGASPGERSTVETGASDGNDAQFTFEEDDDVDPELLSDEERVHRLLKRNGGRMKQASIVKETGWSNAKVSQLLSKMDDDDEIEKLRIGRENLITLPGIDPTEAE